MPGGIDPTRRGTTATNQDQVVRPMFRSLGIAASGLSAQRQRMDIIAQNIANADVTRGPDGGPYKRRIALFEAATSANALFPGPSKLDGSNGNGAGDNVVGSNGTDALPGDRARAIEVPVLQTGGSSGGPGDDGQYGVRIAGYAEDEGEGRLVYEPGHPDANATGFVRYPNIDTTQELVQLMDAKRIYEANATVFQAVKSMLRASLDI